MDRETLASLLSVDRDLWREEAKQIRAFYAQFGDKLPQTLEKELEGALGRKISIQQGKHSGQLTLEYYGAEDLERLSEALRNLRV